MCMEDLRIAANLTNKPARWNSTANRFELDADPLRHAVFAQAADSPLFVYGYYDGNAVLIAQDNKFALDSSDSQVYFGGSLLLRTADYGQILCGPLYFLGPTNDPSVTPYSVTPDVKVQAELMGRMT